MNYNEALCYIHSAPRGLVSTGLDRMQILMEKLGNPQDRLKFVHVAGTNGKGSCCAMLASILRAAGYKTGLFTSPFLHRFNERIQIDGVQIEDDDLVKITEQVKSAADSMADHPTEFELVTAIGFEYFNRKNCDAVVLEVGLGGRLDATNVIPCPECAIISNIGLDHTEILGDTVEKIAAEKAGIIKPGGAVAVYQPEEDSVVSVLAGVCREKGASLRIAEFDELELLKDGLAGQRFCYCDETPLTLPLLGDHQLKNAAVVLEAIEILKERGFDISGEAVETGLKNTVWPGRFEVVCKKPYFVVDGGHNVQCAEAVAGNLDYYFPDLKRVILIGMLRDKDIKGFSDVISQVADVFVCVTPNSPRAMPANELAAMLKEYQKPVLICESIAEGVETAKGAAGKSGMVCAVGSLYMTGDVRACFGLE